MPCAMYAAAAVTAPPCVRNTTGVMDAVSDAIGTVYAEGVTRPLDTNTSARAPASAPARQGLTLVHFSAQRKRLCMG